MDLEISVGSSNTYIEQRFDLQSFSHNDCSGFRIGDKGTSLHETDRKYGTLGRQPREQPPAYHILPRSSYLLIPQDTPDLLR